MCASEVAISGKRVYEWLARDVVVPLCGCTCDKMLSCGLLRCHERCHRRHCIETCRIDDGYEERGLVMKQPPGDISITTGKAIIIHELKIMYQSTKIGVDDCRSKEDLTNAGILLFRSEDRKIAATMKWLFLIVTLVATLVAAVYFGYKGLIWLSGWMDGVEERDMILVSLELDKMDCLKIQIEHSHSRSELKFKR
ncbi:hypothetical protein SADUNF_Sadunf08G0054700 [Salix dunnii]|uniref:Uncharacterized protein n=1 Tax=Salix dunnii TaxID=1413687 RepID=A0A835JVU5_9ROSI|nr:hypothetical protein SADUNF_Sadunf08G0054700 [Salix dunnii]